jgi:hypothetical protein
MKNSIWVSIIFAIYTISLGLIFLASPYWAWFAVPPVFMFLLLVDGMHDADLSSKVSAYMLIIFGILHIIVPFVITDPDLIFFLILLGCGECFIGAAALIGNGHIKTTIN